MIDDGTAGTAAAKGGDAAAGPVRGAQADERPQERPVRPDRGLRRMHTLHRHIILNLAPFCIRSHHFPMNMIFVRSSQ